jgi:hypothetical protein
MGDKMSIKNAMNAVEKNGNTFTVCQGVGYYYIGSRLVTFNVSENLQNGYYDKKLFVELGEFEFVHDIDEKFTDRKKQIDEFISDDFVKWDIEKNKLEFILSAASEEETRYFMNGIYFDYENIVSTDGRRLIYTENQNIHRNCIASCCQCKKLWLKAKDIYIGLRCTKLVFTECEFYIEHIDGQFPMYKKVIPKFSDNYIIQMPAKKELDYFIKKAKITNAKNPKLRYQLTNTKNESEFVSFNVKYLLDIEKFGIDTLYGQGNKGAFTGKHEDVNIVIMPMINNEQ